MRGRRWHPKFSPPTKKHQRIREKPKNWLVGKELYTCFPPNADSLTPFWLRETPSAISELVELLLSFWQRSEMGKWLTWMFFSLGWMPSQNGRVVPESPVFFFPRANSVGRPETQTKLTIRRWKKEQKIQKEIIFQWPFSMCCVTGLVFLPFWWSLASPFQRTWPVLHDLQEASSPHDELTAEVPSELQEGLWRATGHESHVKSLGQWIGFVTDQWCDRG